MKNLILRIKTKWKLPYSDSDFDYIHFRVIKKNNSFKNLSVSKGVANVIYNDNFALTARLHPSSDLLALNQVLINEEYLTLVTAIKINFGNTDNLKIIDAGANVGYSSVYFKNFFPDSQIACVEPDGENIRILELNLKKGIENSSVRIFEKALSSKDHENVIINKSFRDGKDWSNSISLSESETSLKTISILGILKSMNWPTVDLLKIDIEGHEANLFQNSESIRFLDYVKVIAIEIHDEFNIREKIYHFLKENGFVIYYSGEIAIGINARLIN